MRIAFYAPMKPLDDSVPSGDRRVARLFFEALKAAGHEPFIASSLRTYEPAGHRGIQQGFGRKSAAIVKSLLDSYARGDIAPPDLWFTYHLYHKAPDWIGPAVAEALGIPYVIAEASLAAKRARGGWAYGYESALKAARAADLLLALTAADEEGLRAVLGPDAPVRRFAPFVETRGASSGRAKAAARATLARTYPGLNPAAPWLLTVAMMREGVKTDGYYALGRALKSLADRHPNRDWQLLVAGDGPARGDVEAGFWDLPGGRVALFGLADHGLLELCYESADVFAWPGCGEAYGMAYLEAGAAGLPVVACAYPGVSELVRPHESGFLVPPGEPVAFADALAALIADPTFRITMSARARETVDQHHGFARATETLKAILPAERPRSPGFSPGLDRKAVS
jgi:glycosyltransferase involved in cell wall biosynthesis